MIIDTEQGRVFRVTEAREFRKNYETASWYSLVQVEPGDYPVQDKGNGPFVVMPGVRTYDYLPTNFRGVNTGGGVAETVERPDAVTVYLR